MVLVIMGVMMGAVFKGHDLVEQARIRSMSYDFSRIWTALQMYANTYQTPLTADSEAWSKLAEVRLLASPEAPTSKLGGKFALVTAENGTTYLKLGKGRDAKAFLSLSQTRALVAQLRNDNPLRVVAFNAEGNAVDLAQESNKNGCYSVAIILE